VNWLSGVHAALIACCPQEKLALVAALPEVPEDFVHPGAPAVDPRIPGRPQRPELVHPSSVPRRSLGSERGRAALIHAVAHIEFNAINLALDAIHRFPGMPRDYYADWLSVARDEARHHALLAERLHELGYTYGDLPAHNGLWEAAEKTAHDVLVRMALVPRVLEARGLDVTPGMIERLSRVGDARTVEILHLILDEEIGHVGIGSRWFQWLCEGRQLAPEDTFARLLQEHTVQLRPPFNHSARLAAGFSAGEFEAPADL
jgi:uncharacterized ferritin-like protein (DUF455 family)